MATSACEGYHIEFTRDTLDNARDNINGENPIKKDKTDRTYFNAD